MPRCRLLSFFERSNRVSIPSSSLKAQLYKAPRLDYSRTTTAPTSRSSLIHQLLGVTLVVAVAVAVSSSSALSFKPTNSAEGYSSSFVLVFFLSESAFFPSCKLYHDVGLLSTLGFSITLSSIAPTSDVSPPASRSHPGGSSRLYSSSSPQVFR